MSVDTHGLSPRRTALGLATLFGGALLSAGAVIGVAAGVGAVWHATNPPSAAPAAVAAAAPKQASVLVTIKNVKTPGGEQPAYIGPNGVGSPVLFQLHEGTATTLTIVNKSDQPHTFTSAGLGVNVMVPPGPATVHVHLDAKKAGTLPWDCTVPCGAWVMSHTGYMTGSVKVVA